MLLTALDSCEVNAPTAPVLNSVGSRPEPRIWPRVVICRLWTTKQARLFPCSSFWPLYTPLCSNKLG